MAYFMIDQKPKTKKAFKRFSFDPDTAAAIGAVILFLFVMQL